MSATNNSTPPPPWRTAKASPWGALGATGGILATLGLLVFLPIFIWFFCRIEPGQDQMAVLIRKTGTNLEPGEIIASKPGQKGIQEDVLPEGRYFRNPYTWSWIYVPAVDIRAGQLGVQCRLFGKDLQPGEILAKEGTKGILAEVLRPGKYRINPFAYDVKILDAISIRPGHVGVVTHLTGKDVLNDNLPAAERNTELVPEGYKGVVADVLDPGTYYLNPYMVDVREVNLQSQRFEMSGDDSITFLTVDGFNISVEGTVEFAIDRQSASLIAHRIGDMEDVVKKIILPRARGFSRIEGSKHPANNFIVGETRQVFQDNLEKHLREQCVGWGVTVRSVLIRNIEPPQQISTIIREREVAVQDAKKFAQQIEQARSKAELTRQETLALQNKDLVEQKTAAKKALIGALQEQAVKFTAASQELAVAKLNVQAASFEAAATLATAEAERDVIKLDNEAQASVISNQVSAFGSGENLARYALYQKLAPRLQSILTSDSKDGLGGALLPVRSEKKEVQP